MSWSNNRGGYNRYSRNNRYGRRSGYNRYKKPKKRRFSINAVRSFWIGFGAQKHRRGDADYLNGLRSGKTGESFRAGMKAAATSPMVIKE